jgi:chemotaxis methyl-accepting protein methylase
LYSVAMMLSEMGAIERCELLGVDARPSAVAAARAGSYAIEELREVDPLLRERYFRIHGACASIEPRLRARTCWQVADICATDLGGAWDLILCRNVTIYLEDEAADGLWRRLVDQLLPGGFLITGKAEQPPSDLPLRRLAPCIYRATTAC